MASANAGTPLMWAGMIHLLFGNALIGLVEGLALSRMCQTPRGISVGVLVLANYTSAWVGGLLIAGLLVDRVDITIGNVGVWFWLFVGVAFLVTLLVEFPFFWFLLRKKQRAVKSAIRATLVINGLSYFCLFLWYWMASDASMMTGLSVVGAGDLCPKEGYALYYIAPDGSRVLKSDLAGKNEAVLREVLATHGNDRLFVRKNAEGGCDLLLHLESEGRDRHKEEMVLRGFSRLAPLEWRMAEGHAQTPVGSGLNCGPVPSLATSTDWEMQSGFWPVEGIRGKTKKGDLRFRYSMETPFVAWNVRNATQLQGDLVVFQLGGDQICILHPQSRRIALIARGKGPIVAVPSE